MIDQKRGLILISILLLGVGLSGCGALAERLEAGTDAALQAQGLPEETELSNAGGAGSGSTSKNAEAAVETAVEQTKVAATEAARDNEDEDEDEATETPTTTPTATETPTVTVTETPEESPTITVPGGQFTALARTLTALVSTPGATGDSPTNTPGGDTATPSPTGPTATTGAASTPEPDEDGIPCLAMDFIFHYNYLPGSVVEPNTSFYKSWYVENTGSCTWSSNFNIVYHSGFQLGGKSPLSLGATVFPGQRVILTVLLFSNPQPGTYESNWWLESANGTQFGFGENQDQPLSAVIIVPGVQDPVFVSPVVTSPPFYTATPSP